MKVDIPKDELQEIFHTYGMVDPNHLPAYVTVDLPYPMQKQFEGTLQKLSNSDLVNLLPSHVSILNSQRTAIWQQFSAMILANSITLGFFARGDSLSKEDALFIAVFGCFICFVWFCVTYTAWRHFYARIDTTSKFLWPAHGMAVNPIQPMSERMKWFDGMRYLVFLLISLFAFSYAFLLVRNLQGHGISVPEALDMLWRALR